MPVYFPYSQLVSRLSYNTGLKPVVAMSIYFVEWNIYDATTTAKHPAPKTLQISELYY